MNLYFLIVSVLAVSVNSQEIQPEVDDLTITNDTACDVTDSCDDVHGFEAIKWLHRQLDDDQSGTVDVSETDEFIRDELQNPNGNERQLKAFHGSDTSISVLEMWLSWKKSEVHNWTVEETVSWLVDAVELPQYARLFQENNVDGSKLPRMALNNNQYLSAELGIKDPISKQKLALKAMDVVLFGPQKNHNWMKDIILAVVLIFASIVVWCLYRQNVKSQLQVQRMIKDMESLQKAEDALSEMQTQLDKARIEQESLQEEILNKKEAYSDPDSTIFKLQEEVRYLHEELAKAQNMPRGVVPPQLQHWLQLTHEIELKSYNAKKLAAENQLRKAKDECARLRRKGQGYIGSFRLTHGGSIDDFETTIFKAKHALQEVTNDLTERLHRWRQIEMLCGFNIVSNRGISHLEAMLQWRPIPHHVAASTTGSTKSVVSRSGSEGTISEDDSPGSFNNMSSGLSVSSKTGSAYHSGNRRIPMPIQPMYNDLYGAIGQASLISPGTPPNASAIRREEPGSGDLTPQITTTPVTFQVGECSSPVRSAEFPIVSSTATRAGLMKGASFDGCLDNNNMDEDTNANKINNVKNKRKGSVIMNVFKNSFTSVSTLADNSEDNSSSRGSTPALDDKPRKKSGMLGAIRKMSRPSKDSKQNTPER